jgi:hypothetical protein
MVGNFGPSFH